MDQSCDSEIMDDEIYLDDILAKEAPLDAEDSCAEAAANSGLDFIPLVYTTRLDNMVILNSNISNLQPREVTAAILNESKPKFQTFPNDNYSRSCKITYSAMKNKLKKIYHNRNIELETSDLELELPEALIEVDTIKSEVDEDSMGASNSARFEADPFIECEVLGEPLSLCKYTELLKLCRPCSVVLPRLSSREVAKLVTSKVKITKNVNKRTEHQNVPVTIDSSSDEEPLITLNPNLRSKLERNNSEPMYGVKTKKGLVKVRRPSYNMAIEPNYQKNLIASFQNRTLVDGVIEVSELYSKESNTYCYNHNGYLLEYYKEKNYISPKNKNVLFSTGGNYFPVKSCCWVQRDGIIQSLYPKVLLYSSLRFMRNPHTCPAGECSCCCQKRKGFDKPDIEVTGDASSDVPLPFLKEAIEIQALEDEIQSTIIKMEKEPRINPKDIARNLVENPITKLSVKNKVSIGLIDQALLYKKPLPKKPIDNRRLLSSKLEKTQSSVIVLRNYAADEREIYELNPDGEIKSYLKLVCFNNTDRPEVKKLLQKTKQINDVCCWFKRENLINKLIKSKTLHHSAVKFLRTRHTCTGNECNCCCEPAEAKEVTLTDITFPSRPSYWPQLLNKIKAPPKVPKVPKPSTWLDNYVIKPAVCSVPTPAVSPPAIMPRLLPKLPPKTMPAVSKINVPVLRLDNRYIKPASYYTATTTTKPTTDEDCQFVSETAAPTLETNSTPIAIPNNITNVQGDDLSKEVNTLITSILDRFKDVRLTINSDGKVAAALNTPVSSLTTVELKVLANILSYAQSQVNSLGLNSGMSLSNIISLKAGDQQTGNFNINNLSPGSHVNPSFKSATANIPGEPNNVIGSSISTSDRHDMNDFFTKTSYMKQREYADSFNSLLSTQLEAKNSNSSVPVIQNVFSLQDQEIKTEYSSATVFCRKPGNQNQRPSASKPTQKVYENTKKRTGATNTEVTPPVSKKIRVLSPSKLRADPLDKMNAIANSVYEPLPATQTHTIEVDGGPGEPLLSNDNFQVVAAIPSAQLPCVTKPRIIRQEHFKAFTPQPKIVVSPLQVANFNDETEEASPIGTLFSAASVGTSTEDIEIPEVPVPMKIEQVFYEEEDCILGV